MKKILSILGTITLIGTSTTSLVACNTPQEYTPEELSKLKEENKINTTNETIKNNLEWMASQETPFNQIDNKYYFLVWRNSKNGDWNINKFNNDKENILITGDTQVEKWHHDLIIRVPEISNIRSWKNDDGTYFKSVYRWKLDKNIPSLVVNKETGKIKVEGE